MSASGKMMEIKTVLEKAGHKVVVPKNTERYASGETSMESNTESTQHKIDNDLIRGYYLLIKDADAVVVANYDKGAVKNYVGGNSFLEAGFAHVLDKKLYFMNDVPELFYSDELRAMQPVVLHGDLSEIKNELIYDQARKIPTL
jgi:hypothetical protein